MAYSDPNDPRARESRRKHYRANKEAYKARAVAKREELQRWTNMFKREAGCIDCGTKYPDEPWLLEFDHLGDKVTEISKMLRLGSLQKLQEEVAKCDVVCVLCHRRRTARRAGWTNT